MSEPRYTSLIGVDDAARLLAAHDAGSPEAPLVFDCRFDLADVHAGEHAYAAAHLPGAHYLHLERDLSGPTTGRNGRHPLPARDALARVLAAHGMTPGRQVVAYDAQGGIFTARLWWLMRWLGHEAVAVLDGGLPAWRGAGLPVTDDTSPALPGTFTPATPLTGTIDADALAASLPRAAYLIVDARSPDRFRGENETLDPVGGHIPGALNRFFKNNLTSDGRFKPAALLREEFTALLGTVPPARAVMQCGSGVTACHHLLAMEVAGLQRAVLYPGSWSEWCADPARPVATGDVR